MQLSADQEKTLIKLQRRFKNMYQVSRPGPTHREVRPIDEWRLESETYSWDELLTYARSRGCDV